MKYERTLLKTDRKMQSCEPQSCLVFSEK